MSRPRYPGLGMAWPAPRRPAPGGGLAVLVVVTVLAALAAPHAKAVRGLVAGGLPTITVPTPPAPPPAPRPPSGADLHQRRWLPTRRRLPLPAPGPPGPHGAGGRGRPLPGSGVVPAQRPFLVRQGHPPGLQPQPSGAAVDVDQVDGRPVSPVEHRGPAAGGLDRPGPGRGPAERGRLPLDLRRPALVQRRRPPGASACRLPGPDPAGWWPVIAAGPGPGAGGARHHRPGLSAGPGRDRLRRRPGPRPGRARPPGPRRRPSRPAGAGPSRPGPPPPTFPAPTCGCTARPAPATGIPWPVLAAHRQGRVRPRPGPAARGAVGQQLGRGLWADADRLCARAARPATPGPATAAAAPTTPPQAIPAAARYLVDHGARRNLDRAIYAYNHSRAYVAKVKQLARRYARGGGRR